MDRNELIKRMEEGFEPEFSFFYGHQPRRDGTVRAECFSQWWPAEFEAEGVVYATAEHFMMAEKARVFGDQDMLARILDAASPHEAKALGRQVRNFDNPTWKARRFEAVVQGNIHKFSQNEAERAYLLSTGEAILVEASPTDRIWGIGMGAKNPDASDPTLWRGSNLLGFALIEARTHIRNEMAGSG